MTKLPKSSMLTLLAAAFLLVGTPAGSQEDLTKDLFTGQVPKGSPVYTKVMTRLHKQREGNSTFVQTKKISALKRPLVSKGVLSISEKSGVCWNTQSPFKTILVVSSQGIKTKVGDGDVVFESAKDKVEVRSFAKIMLALFNADEDAMREQFDMYFKGTDKAWALGLKPRNKILARFLDKIVVTGATQIDRIQIFEKTGDTADIRVAAVTDGNRSSQSECFE